MRVSCKYCGLMHEQGTVCSRKPKQKSYKRNEEGTRFNSFRWGGEWKAKRLAIRQRDRHCCRVCLELADQYGTYEQDRRVQVKGLSVHHIDSLAEDWNRRLDDSNLITLCSYHHEMAEDGRINKNVLRHLAENDVNFLPALRG